MSNIDTTIQEIKSDLDKANYFFSQVSKYQETIHKWLKPLYDKGFLSLNEENKFKYLRIEFFLETVAIQNKEQEKSEITELLLLIANNTISQTTNSYIVLSMMKVIFSLPIKNIKLKHIDAICKNIKNSKYRSPFNYYLGDIVLPVLIENQMKKHLLKLLPVIFGYKFTKEAFSHKEPISIIEHYNLQKLLKRHSKDIINLTRIDGLKIVIDIAEKIIKKEKACFNTVWIRVLRVKTDDEKKQHDHFDRYENQLIFFIKDFLELLPVNITKTYIERFLLEETHSIFTRLALHTINYKYDELKDVFWQWMDKSVQFRKDLEFWTLLNESSGKFTSNEFDKVIGWIEGLDCKEYRPDDSDEQIKSCNAYRRKEYLLCLKDDSNKADELYTKYNEINSSELDHPGFGYWSGGVQRVTNSHPIPNLCQNNAQDIIIKINSFNPADVTKKDPFDNDNRLMNYVAEDLSLCIQNNPNKFIDEIDDFSKLDDIYKRKLVKGFKNAWNNKNKFDCGKVLDFIWSELTPDFFNPDKEYKNSAGEIADFIECGMSDENAFNKACLPRVKEILLKLINNKEEERETDIYNDLSTHVLNSNNGKVLHALIRYTLRYGRLHSSKEIKWEDEIKNFFTEQLVKNDIYSKSVFTILTTYLRQLRFLDNKWVNDNFNKIFPLSDLPLWKIAIDGYCFHHGTVYEDDYKLFKENGHIDKALHYDSVNQETRNRVIAFISIAYINKIDIETIKTILETDDKNNIVAAIKSISQIYRNTEDEKALKEIKKLWRKIYDLYKDKDAENIFAELNDWFILIKKIKAVDMKMLKHTIAHIKQDGFSGYYEIVEAFKFLIEKHPKEIGQLYLKLIENDVYPEYKTEEIQNIVEKIKQTDEGNALQITNKYKQKGFYFLNNIV